MKRALIRFVSVVLILILITPAGRASEKLKQGDSGSTVLQMQLALQSLGYSIKTDGKYGKDTVAVVKEFQRDYKLTADGVAGSNTLSLLSILAPAYFSGTSSSAPSPTPVPTNANGITSARVIGGSLNLRTGAAETASIVTEIPNGAQVTVVFRGDMWSSVIYKGMAGYVMTAYLSFDNSPVPQPTAAILLPTAAPTVLLPNTGNVRAMVLTTGGSLNLRQSPNSTSKILTTIPYGTWLAVTARGAEWCQVQYNGIVGYVMSKFLSFDASSVNTPVPTATPFVLPTQAPYSQTQETAIVTTTGGSLNLRQSADANAKVIAAIPNGTAIQVLSRGTIWCSVLYMGTYGYVMTSFLRFPGSLATLVPTATPTYPPVQGNPLIAYVTTSGGSLNLREEAQNNARILFRIPNGSQLIVTQQGSVWCAVQYQSMSGYVMTSFLRFAPNNANPSTPTPAPTPQSNTPVGTALVTTSGGTLNLRSEASSNAKVLLAMPNASSVTVYARGETWSQVSYNGTKGYCLTQYLTFLTGSVPVQKADSEDDDPSKYTRTLKKGMTGSDVTWVQNRLIELGYSLTLTHLYDDATFAAVKAFQTQNGLTADGLAGAQTFAILKSDSARKAEDAKLSYSTLRIDDTGDGVRQIQKDLKALGYPVTVSGTYDESTHNAIVAFQQRNSLVISGIADSLTRQTLHSGNGKPYSTPVESLPANEGWIQGPSVSQLKLLHWVNDIKPTVKAGQTFTVFDPNSNLSWKLVFYSLGRHADSQPASWRDTQIMNRAFGSTSWTIHPVYVQLPSGQWTLATMHNRPHLYGSIMDNGFGGHLCVHFLRDMAEAKKNDPNYGVNNQVTLRNAWKALTGETVN
ncbi:MAG: SH3 domain-containing protein [Clostridia bacterium]|nr:SH3 domain-containing protein [Clostridia bacterium]